MPIETRNHSAPRNATFFSVVLVVAVLYFARVVLIPLALAVLFSFLLAPLVQRLRHWHFGRVLSVLCAVTIAFGLIAVLSGLVWIQLADLGQRLPEYQESIRAKVHSVRDSSSGTIERLTRAVQDFSQELAPAVPESSPEGGVKPVPVEIRRNAFSPLDAVRGILGPVINIVLTAGIVVVFVIFMLFQKEDLRDRLIRMIGAARINMTTRALDDAARRLSRFLLAQLGLNVGYGIMAGIGLFFMNVPNPVLWAVLAVPLRYVPYLGTWVAAAMPAAIALATAPGWLLPVGILLLYFLIDLLVINLVEPLLYGGSTGISPLAILIAAVFWTWLWGPIGLILAPPLTVCLVVIGRYVPSLEFLSVMLGDQPVLTAHERFYQRLLAMDLEEATGVAEEFLKEKKSLEQLYDDVIIPALALSEEERHRGKLDDKRQRFITENARLAVEDLHDRAEELMADKLEDKPEPADATGHESMATLTGVCVVAMPARDKTDEIGALMLTHLLNRKGIRVRQLSASLASERLQEAESTEIVCILAVPPQGYLHTRYLAKRLKARFPGVKIIAALLHYGDVSEIKQRRPSVPCDDMVTSLQQAVSLIVSLAPCTRKVPEQTAFSS